MNLISKKPNAGDELTFTADVDGVCQIKAGDKAIYLGNNQARITTGKSEGWLVTLTISAPITC